MPSQTNLMPLAKHFQLVVEGNTITDTDANTCAYTIEYSSDGVNWTTYAVYTDQVQVTEQPIAPVGTGGSSGETKTLPT